MTIQLSEELEKTVEVLRGLLRRISDLNKALEPLENELGAADFAESGI